MLHHLSFGVSNLLRSATFYDAVLSTLGYAKVWSLESAIGYGLAGGDDLFCIKARPGIEVVPPSGFHLAFSAPSRKAVEVFYQTALLHGGKDNGAPGLRLQYGSSYFACFVLDPDSYPLEAVTTGNT
jgi:catechol 2,3-dioxygenase-like lactoylglutathione lyase family enzyme